MKLMYGRRSIGLVIAVLFAGGAIFFVASKSLTTLTQKTDRTALEKTSRGEDGETIKYSPAPFNAFLEPLKSYAPAPVYSDGTKTQESLPPAQIPPADPNVPDTETPTSSPRLSLLETLAIPPVGPEEMIIDPSGIKNVEEYGNFLAVHAKEVSFPKEKMQRILRDDKGIVLMPMKIVEKALGENNFEQIRESLPLLKEFVAARMQFGRSMKVTGDAVGIHQKVLGFDKLTIELLDKASQVAVSALSKQELESFYRKYKNTVSLYNKEFYSKYQALSAAKNPWYAFLDIFGLRKIAHAVGLIVGGLITTITPCICDPGVGYAFVVGPPLGGPFYITYAQLANPLYTAGVISNAWILGFYSPGGVCMQGVPPYCFPGPPYPIGIPTLAGTGFGL